MRALNGGRVRALIHNALCFLVGARTPHFYPVVVFASKTGSLLAKPLVTTREAYA